MKIGIMQPYFLPYLGYFQILKAVDIFVIYDNIEYTKKGWINRNRYLCNGIDKYFTIPLKRDSDYLNINERYLANDYLKTNKKTLRQMEAAYFKAPFFKVVWPIVEDVFKYNETSNLFDFINYSICKINKYLEINTQIFRSSQVNSSNHLLKSENRVVDICKALNGKTYINPIGGQQLYNKKTFQQENIELKFHKTINVKYNQFINPFIENLSIIDVLMFNDKSEIYNLLNNYELI